VEMCQNVGKNGFLQKNLYGPNTYLSKLYEAIFDMGLFRFQKFSIMIEFRRRSSYWLHQTFQIVTVWQKSMEPKLISTKTQR